MDTEAAFKGIKDSLTMAERITDLLKYAEDRRTFMDEYNVDTGEHFINVKNAHEYDAANKLIGTILYQFLRNLDNGNWTAESAYKNIINVL